MENNEFNEFNESTFDYEIIAAAENQEQKAKQGKGLATASMVLGIISLVWLVVTFGVGNLITILPLIGLILGIVFAVSRKDVPEIRKAATPGIVMNSICIGLGILGWIGIIAFISSIDTAGLEDFNAMLTDTMRDELQNMYNTDREMYDNMYQVYYDMFPSWFEGIGCFIKSLFH